MVAWKQQIKPTDIQKVASYILSLQGTNPADAKAAEGDKHVVEVAVEQSEGEAANEEVAEPETDATDA